MVTQKATIQNEYGIHVRPSAVIVKSARDYDGTIIVCSEKGASTDIKNLLGLISLGLTMGQVVTISVTGPDEAEWCSKVVELFQTHFDFPRK